MVDYALTRFATSIGEFDTVVAAMEVQLENVTSTKTIYLNKILRRGDEFVGVLLYAT